MFSLTASLTRDCFLRPVWVWVLVGLGVVGALGLLLVVLFFYPGLLVRKTGGQGRRGQGENQETGAAFLAESAT